MAKAAGLLAGKAEQALPIFEERIRQSPDDERGYCGAILSLIKLRNLDGAAECAEKLIRLRPGEAYPHGAMGAVLDSAGKFDEALACYEKMAAMDPDDLLSRFRIAQLLLLRGDEKEWDKRAVKIIRTRPTSRSAARDHANIVDFLGEKYRGRAEDLIPSVAKMSSIVRHGPQQEDQDPELLLEEANSLADGGRYAEAAKAADRALSVDPGFQTARSVKATMLIKLGRHAEAIACVDEILLAGPDDTEYLGVKGMLLERAGRPQEALACYDRILELDRGDMTARYLKCGLLALEGDADGLLECYRAALEAKPSGKSSRMQKEMRRESRELDRCVKQSGSVKSGFAKFMKETGVAAHPRWGRKGQRMSVPGARGRAKRGRPRAGRRA